VNRKRKIVLIAALLIITELLAGKISRVQSDQHLAKVLINLNHEMESIFNDALMTSEVLKEIVLISPNKSITEVEFNKASKALLETYTHVDSLLLLPNGIVSYAYPYAENKGAIGHNVLEDINRKLGAKSSICEKKTAVIGPVKLVQNGKLAFILRASIADENGFIGLTSSVIHLDSIIEKIERSLKNNEIENYSIVGFNPDSKNCSDKIITSQGTLQGYQSNGDINIFKTTWKISVSQENSGTLIRLLVFAVLSTLTMLIVTPAAYFKKYRFYEKEKSTLQKEAHTDFLTGLLNRRGFDNKLDALTKSDSYGAVAVLDIDFFKSINDRYGHDIGDSALVHFSAVCATQIRDHDILSRTGGEEFMLLMLNTELSQAQEICERLRKMISQNPLIHDELSIKMTASVGLSSFVTPKDISIALSLADEALYKAKQGGRNRVCVNV